MSWQTVRLAECTPQPWKNGGGLTRELLAWPSVSDWRVRLSVADITADGPFSAFHGIQRWFAVIEGDGVCINVNGEATQLRTASSPFSFAGAAQTSCTLLGGATRDFNLMLRGATGTLRRIQGHAQGALEAMSVRNAIKIIAVFSIKMRAIVQFDESGCLLEPGMLAWRLVDTPGADINAAWSVQADNALWMEITA